MCQDSHTNEGLLPLTYRGSIQGFWRGKFLFYDFEFYREILSGNLRGVYTGMFAEQAVEAELRETLVKVKKEDVGGDGPLLTAGFKDMGSLEEETKFLEQGYGHEIVHEDDEDEEGWTIPKHVSYDIAEIVDFRLFCNKIWIDLIEGILYICDLDFEIILVLRCMVSRITLKLEVCFVTYYVFIQIFYYGEPKMST